jgi:hypothetical protein
MGMRFQTHVAADNHFTACGFAAMVVVCLDLNSGDRQTIETQC